MRGRLRCAALLALLSCTALAQAELPAFGTVRDGFRSSYAVLLDRNGAFLHARRVDEGVNRLAWVALEEVSPALLEAVVFAEDRDFWRHHGIDWGATARASAKLLGGDRSRGASTITMQLAGLLDDELRWRRGGRSLTQKWRQMRAARALERRWSKRQILEAWLNLVVFRGDLQGLGAASQALFGKAPAGLTRSEGLLLAALLPAPSAPPARVVRHACALVQAGFAGTDCQAIRDLAFSSLARRLAPYPENPALEALAAQLLREPGLVLRSTLDAALQRDAEAALVAQLAQLHERYVDAGAVLVLDNASGEVRAYVANAGLVEGSRFVDGIRALRQAGSTLKPFLFAEAFDRKYLTAASILEDAPVALPAAGGIYAPQNYEKDFKGPVSARVALAGSLNVPAVRVLTLVGVEDFWTTLRASGFASLTEAPDFYGYALALGSADVTLWGLANAYRMLANRGLYTDAGFLPGETHDARRVFSPEAAFLVADILADRGARAVTFDFESPLALPFRAAVKTGTSKDMRDNWCIGFSARHTVAVWVGNLDGAPMRDVSGITGAAPVWAAVMQKLDGQRFHGNSEEGEPPAGLQRRRVTFTGLAEPAREEWFLAGTELQRVDYVPNVATHILYPVDDAVIAIDPDIPARRQRVRFRAELAGEGGEWWLDGRRLGPAGNLDWSPVAGSHRLQLRDRAGNSLDSVRFVVRGRPGLR